MTGEQEKRKGLLPKLTIKTRMSLWFTLALALICAVLLASAAVAFGAYGEQVARAQLVEAVQTEASTIEGDPSYESRLGTDELADSDFVNGDVQLMVYGKDGHRFAGLFLHNGLDKVPFTSSDAPRKIELDGSAYYYYDERVRIRHGDDYWVRGIVRAESSLFGMLAKSGYLAVMIPVLLVVAFIGGRLLAGRLLRPVREIDEAARDIRQSGDLSQRVPVTGAGDELSALATDMNEMLDTLERNFEAERVFASSASHELRTPVAVILAQCEYAADNASGEGELRESLAAVHKQGEKMSGIIEALLMLTRMDQNTDRYVRDPFDLSALTRGACEDFRRLNQRACMQHELAENVVVQANRELVALAFDNLLRNAVRYGGEDVTIRVTLTAADGMAVLSVSDDGPGIARADIESIWDLFYRADASRSSDGLGLGLPLVRKIAQYNGGTAEAESTEGEGATFIVRLPLAV